jgi:dCMP deaminase
MARMDEESNVSVSAPARPPHDEYFMGIAFAVRRRAVCLGRKVGAVLARDDRVIATGYNGTPEHMPNCDEHERGCLRCSRPEQFEPGTGYDLCICVHAEQNALLSAARFGIAVEGATLYTTLRPCFGCTKEALQARIHTIYYLHDWSHPNEAVARQYEILQARLPGGVRPLFGVSDPGDQPEKAPLEATGHEGEEQAEPAPPPRSS